MKSLLVEDTINGIPVLASERTPGDSIKRAGRVVLLKSPGEYRYVTGWQGDGDPYWCFGRYFNSFEAARLDFNERVAKDCRTDLNWAKGSI